MNTARKLEVLKPEKREKRGYNRKPKPKTAEELQKEANERYKSSLTPPHFEDASKREIPISPFKLRMIELFNKKVK